LVISWSTDLSGIGVPKNNQAGLEANTRAAAAGHARAMYNMGAFHAAGQPVPKDLTKAAGWYQRASDAGNPRATVTLAVMYAGKGVPKDADSATDLFDLAEYMGQDVNTVRQSVGR
jgi:TPR repeat protein